MRGSRTEDEEPRMMPIDQQTRRRMARTGLTALDEALACPGYTPPHSAPICAFYVAMGEFLDPQYALRLPLTDRVQGCPAHKSPGGADRHRHRLERGYAN